DRFLRVFSNRYFLFINSMFMSILAAWARCAGLSLLCRSSRAKLAGKPASLDPRMNRGRYRRRSGHWSVADVSTVQLSVGVLRYRAVLVRRAGRAGSRTPAAAAGYGQRPERAGRGPGAAGARWRRGLLRAR